jgi:hypothetical protein
VKVREVKTKMFAREKENTLDLSGCATSRSISNTKSANKSACVQFPRNLTALQAKVRRKGKALERK